MGKGRDGRRRAQLRRQLERYDGDALWTLVTAAGAAPGVRHRWATVGHLVATALRADRRGRRPVRPGELQGLLDACVADDPVLTRLEDFLPEDPRDEVLIRIDEALVRVFPGSVERPVADVRRALLVARATDDALVGRLGFGIRDLVSATVAFVDHAFAIMAPMWPTGELSGDGPVVLSAKEVDAAAVLADATPASLGLSMVQVRALDWATGTAADVPYEPDHPQSPFGQFLRVARHGPTMPASWMPLSHIPEILGCAVGDLARQVADVPTARRAFAQAAADATRRALWRFSSRVFGPPDHVSGPIVAPGNRVQWIAMLGSDRAVLVQLISELDVQGLPFEDVPVALQVVRDAYAAPGDPIRVPMPGGSIGLGRDVEVVPLLVVASSTHVAVPQLPGLPAMSLDDLCWAATRATADSDLFLFCRDLARPDRPAFFGWEAINVWEWWHSNGKSLFSGGHSPTFMQIAPHAGSAEWERHRRLAPLERALQKLALPGLDEIDAIDHELSGPPVAYQWVDPQTLIPGPDRTASVGPGIHLLGDLLGWAIHIADVPVAILAAHPEWPLAHHRLLNKLASAFAFGFRQIDDVWRSAHSNGSMDSYVINLVPRDRQEGPFLQMTTVEPATAAHWQITRAVIEVSPDTLATDTGSTAMTVRAAMASAVEAMIRSTSMPVADREQVVAAWNAAPPTLTVRAQTMPTVRNDLPAPIKIDHALIANVNRTVATAVYDAEVQPGTYTGDAAKALDRDVLAPTALRVLIDRLQEFTMDDVVLTGMRELERIVADRDQQIRSLGQSAGVLNLGWDPVRRFAEVQRDHLTLRRCAEVVVEAALRAQPGGRRRVDRIAWAELTAAADAYLSAAMRSEHIHHQVRPTALKISSSYEIETADDPNAEPADASVGAGLVYDLDMDALETSHSRLQLGELADDNAGGTEPEETLPASTGSSVAHTSLVNPELDAALREAFGASGSDILTTLFGLAHWPLTDDDEDVITASAEAVVEHVLNYTTLGDDADGRTCVEHAIALLTSTSEHLVAADWSPWHVRSRRRRLIIQPLPTLSTGSLVVAPHFCLGALSAYRRHLSQGQLPWTQPARDEPPLPRAVAKALAKVRDERNKALERAVAADLRGRGWSVIENVKETDPQRLKVPALSGEIDIVAGNRGNGTLWLLEVKDPADTFVVPEIRRHLDTFFADRDSKLSYAIRLQRKVDDLAPHINAVATALGLPTRADGYELAAAFVTRTPVPAAFVTGPFPFTSLQEGFTLLTPIDPLAV